MSTTASAVATVDSATTQNAQVETPASPAFDAADQKTWSAPQRENWNKTGEQPTKQDSAPATKKDTAVPDPAPDSKKNAASASDSATDKTQQPHLKTKEDTEKRFKEILDELGTLKRQNEELRSGKTTEKRDTKQESQPAPEVKTAPLKKFLEEFFAKAENKGKAYEDGVEAWQVARDADVAKTLEQKLRQELATESARKSLDQRVADAKKRYPDYDARIQPAVQALTSDEQIPFAVKAMVNGSPVFTDLLYVLGDPASLADLVKTAKTDPASAIRKIVLTEQLVMAELAKANGKDKAGDGKGADDKGGKRDATTGKFVTSENKDDAEPKPRAPKPPSEVGGRGTSEEDALVAAAKSGSFKDFEAEQWRRKRASAS